MRTTDADRLLEIVGELDLLLVGMLEPVFKEFGIGREHWHVMRRLQDGRGHAMGEISESLGLRGGTATRVVDFLTANMLVYRRSDPIDRRRVLVHLAEPGRDRLRRLEEALRGYTAPILASFDRSERQHLVELLERLVGSANGQSDEDSVIRKA